MSTAFLEKRKIVSFENDMTKRLFWGM